MVEPESERQKSDGAEGVSLTTGKVKGASQC